MLSGQFEARVGSLIAATYVVRGVLGRGGSGMVLRCTHTYTGRDVAVKVLLAGSEADERALARFWREARALGVLRHPNVVDVLDMVEDEDGTPFLVLELLRGETLAQLLARHGTLRARDALDVCVPIVQALCEAHARGLVHRDVKPANIFLAIERGAVVPKLLDFGIARSSASNAPHLTHTGIQLGTPGFMSPEQLRGQRAIGPATDVWALAATLTQVLVGRGPSLDGAAPEYGAALPAPLAEVLRDALQSDPLARPRDASALLDALTRASSHSGMALVEPVKVEVLEGASAEGALPTVATAQASSESPRPLSARPQVTRPAPTRRPWLRAVAAIGAASIVASAAFFTMTHAQRSPTPSVVPASVPTARAPAPSYTAPPASPATAPAVLAETRSPSTSDSAVTHDHPAPRPRAPRGALPTPAAEPRVLGANRAPILD